MILFLAKYQFPVAFAFMQEINLAEQKPYTRKEKKSFPPSCISAENPFFFLLSVIIPCLIENRK